MLHMESIEVPCYHKQGFSATAAEHSNALVKEKGIC